MLHLTMLTLFGLVLMLLQGSLPISAPRPNMIIILSVYMGQLYLPVPGLIISFILGHLIDTASGGLLGMNSFSMVFICFFSYILSNWVVVQDWLAQIALIFFNYIIYAWIVYMLFLFFNLDVTGSVFFYNNLKDALITALLSLFIVPVVRKMEHLFRFKNERVTRAGSIEL